MYIIASTGRCLFYMPHCPYRLYCNLLWANMSCLDELVILGNRYVYTCMIYITCICLFILLRFTAAYVYAGYIYVMYSFESYSTRRIPPSSSLMADSDSNPTDLVARITPYTTELTIWSESVIDAIMKGQNYDPSSMRVSSSKIAALFNRLDHACSDIR